jgi:hypothetical protein
MPNQSCKQDCIHTSNSAGVSLAFGWAGIRLSAKSEMNGCRFFAFSLSVPNKNPDSGYCRTFSPSTYLETPPTNHSNRVVSLSMFSTLHTLLTEVDIPREAVRFHRLVSFVCQFFQRFVVIACVLLDLRVCAKLSRSTAVDPQFDWIKEKNTNRSSVKNLELIPE